MKNDKTRVLLGTVYGSHLNLKYLFRVSILGLVCCACCCFVCILYTLISKYKKNIAQLEHEGFIILLKLFAFFLNMTKPNIKNRVHLINYD
jgi:hypothetical protein